VLTRIQDGEIDRTVWTTKVLSKVLHRTDSDPDPALFEEACETLLPESASAD
jgi:hypothetical protein